MFRLFNDGGIGGFVTKSIAIEQVKRYKTAVGNQINQGFSFLFERADFIDLVNREAVIQEEWSSFSVNPTVLPDFYRAYLGINNAGYTSLLVVPVAAIPDTQAGFVPAENTHQNCLSEPGCKSLISWKPTSEGSYTSVRTKDGYFEIGGKLYVLNVSLPCPPFGCDKDSELFNAV